MNWWYLLALPFLVTWTLTFGLIIGVIGLPIALVDNGFNPTAAALDWLDSMDDLTGWSKWYSNLRR
jgi:hypothetical protein